MVARMGADIVAAELRNWVGFCLVASLLSMHSYLTPLHAVERALRNARTRDEHEHLRIGLFEASEGIRHRIRSDIESLQVQLERVLLIRGVKPSVFYVSALAAVMFGISFRMSEFFSSSLIPSLAGREAIIAASLALASYGTLTATVSLGAATTGRIPVVLASALAPIAILGFAISRMVGGVAYANIVLIAASCLGGVLLFAGQLASRARELEEQIQSLNEQLGEVDVIVRIAAALEFVPPSRQHRPLPFEQAEFIEAATKVNLCEVELAVAQSQVEGERQLFRGVTFAAISYLVLTAVIYVYLAVGTTFVPFIVTGALFFGVLSLRAMAIYHQDARHIESMSSEIGSMRRQITEAETFFGVPGDIQMGEA